MKKSTFTLAMLAGHVALFSVTPAFAAGFIEDSNATVAARNFYYQRDDKNTADNRNEANEWGQALLFNYKSGYTQSALGLGVDVTGLVGVRLDGGGDGDINDSRKPGQLFPLDSDGSAVSTYSKAGITAKAKVAGTELKIGALQPKLPVATFNDGRLLPQLFEGGQIVSNDIKPFTLTAGQLVNTKTRSSTDNVGLRVGGSTVDAESDGFYFLGADYKISPTITAQYYFGLLDDYYRQHFIGLTHNSAFAVGNLKTDLRYFDSHSVGKNSTVAGRAAGYKSSGYWESTDTQKGEIDNRTWSLLFTYSLQGHSIDLGHQRVVGKSDFPFLNQGDGSSTHLITDRQIGKFQNAGEQTWLAGYGYDFAQAGIPGLKASVVYLTGEHIASANQQAREWERDIRLDYSVQQGALKGVNLSWRNASLRGNDVTDQDENRLIISYSVALK